MPVYRLDPVPPTPRRSFLRDGGRRLLSSSSSSRQGASPLRPPVGHCIQVGAPREGVKGGPSVDQPQVSDGGVRGGGRTALRARGRDGTGIGRPILSIQHQCRLRFRIICGGAEQKSRAERSRGRGRDLPVLHRALRCDSVLELRAPSCTYFVDGSAGTCLPTYLCIYLPWPRTDMWAVAIRYRHDARWFPPPYCPACASTQPYPGTY